MARTIVSIVAVALLLVLCFAASTVVALDDAFIRCKVCNRAIEHVFKSGAALRAHCKDKGSDPRCDYSNLHSFGIEEMVHTVCDDLPKTHQAIHESEFDLVLQEDPQHSDAVALAIKRTCVKWIHDQHDDVATYIFANLDAQKSAALVLPSLTNRFCRHACNPNYKKKIDHHDEL